MATTLPIPGPQQPVSDDTARMLVFDQIIGSDIPPGQTATSTVPVWNGDWHQALKTASAQWTPTRRQRIANRARRIHPAKAALRAGTCLLHTTVFVAAGIAVGIATDPHLPVLTILDADVHTSWTAGTLTAVAVGLGLNPAAARVLPRRGAQPTDPTTRH